jgi:hypothetical protein
MRRFAVTVASVVALAGFGVSGAMASPPANPGNSAGTGQPGTANPNGVSCPSTITTPQGFNSPGFANAEQHYANPGTTPSNNPHAVSEYDIACYQTGQTH